jgi:uncharacterized protein
MPTKPPMIFINLPVSSFPDSITFYTALGFVQNKSFTEPGNVAMMSLPPFDSPDSGVGIINVMLLTHEKFQSFMPPRKQIADAKKSTEVLLCLSCESKEEVDEMVEKAMRAGGKGETCPKQEMGDAMYGNSFEDLDGHVWELVWMSEAMVKGEEPPTKTTDRDKEEDGKE